MGRWPKASKPFNVVICHTLGVLLAWLGVLLLIKNEQVLMLTLILVANQTLT